MTYYIPKGGLVTQTQKSSNQAIFTDSYAVIPKEVLSDITASLLPAWNKTRLWILARPMTGFAETFSHYLMEVNSGGGSLKPEVDNLAQSVLFVVNGCLELTINDKITQINVGDYVYIPIASNWNIQNKSDKIANFHWIRKRYQQADGIKQPTSFIINEKKVEPTEMPDTNGTWSTTKFVEPSDLRHDMHVNIVNFKPGGVIPFAETHVMEHGLYILEGKAVYYLNQDWVEVEAGDYLWLRAFCPQACYAGGPGNFRYLLYKDVNRHVPLTLSNS